MIVDSCNNPKDARVGGQHTPFQAAGLPPQGKICDMVWPTALKQSLTGEKLKELRKKSQASIRRNENIQGRTPVVLGIAGAPTAGVLGVIPGAGIGLSFASEMGSFASGVVGALAGAASTFIVEGGF